MNRQVKIRLRPGGNRLRNCCDPGGTDVNSFGGSFKNCFDPGCGDTGGYLGAVNDLAASLATAAEQLACCCLAPLAGFASLGGLAAGACASLPCCENERFDDGDGRCCNPFAGRSDDCCGNCDDGGPEACSGCRSGDCCGSCSCCGASSCGGDCGCWPCWLPHRIEPVNAVVGPGSVVRVKVDIVNRSLSNREFLIAATGAGASVAKGDPSTADLGPMDCGELAAILHVPAAATHHEPPISLLLWVRGCKDYCIPVCLRVHQDAPGATFTRRVVEQTDDCHTWRDHFYVSRPCAGSRQG